MHTKDERDKQHTYHSKRQACPSGRSHVTHTRTYTASRRDHISRTYPAQICNIPCICIAAGSRPFALVTPTSRYADRDAPWSVETRRHLLHIDRSVVWCKIARSDGDVPLYCIRHHRCCCEQTPVERSGCMYVLRWRWNARSDGETVTAGFVLRGGLETWRVSLMMKQRLSRTERTAHAQVRTVVRDARPSENGGCGSGKNDI
ncbi:hypothetical protein LXA43DRAFT_746164 [Ganoderma leucocontextum]|nr:hypothetical protein LXA43DRAFT_746164 [Ganoderma leucocontextum]